jgi:VanZ family protein
MSESYYPVRRRGARHLVVWGLLWGLLLLGWTAALLTTYPVHVAHAALPPPAQFPTAKVLHVSAYAVLAALSAWPRPLGRLRWLLLAFLSLHAAGTEYLQQYVPLRGPSAADVLIDHAGILLGVVVTWKWWWRAPS